MSEPLPDPTTEYVVIFTGRTPMTRRAQGWLLRPLINRGFIELNLGWSFYETTPAFDAYIRKLKREEGVDVYRS